MPVGLSKYILYICHFLIYYVWKPIKRGLLVQKYTSDQAGH